MFNIYNPLTALLGWDKGSIDFGLYLSTFIAYLRYNMLLF